MFYSPLDDVEILSLALNTLLLTTWWHWDSFSSLSHVLLTTWWRRGSFSSLSHVLLNRSIKLSRWRRVFSFLPETRNINLSTSFYNFFFLKILAKRGCCSKESEVSSLTCFPAVKQCLVFTTVGKVSSLPSLPHNKWSDLPMFFPSTVSRVSSLPFLPLQ